MITIFNTEDWVAVYRDGFLLVEGHSLSFEEGFEIGQSNPDSEIKHYYFNDDDFNEDNLKFPNQLADVELFKFWEG